MSGTMEVNSFVHDVYDSNKNLLSDKIVDYHKC